MKNKIFAAIICIVLFFAGTSVTIAQRIDTQPSPPFANAPFTALVYFDNPFDSHAGFDLTTLRVAGNTVFVAFDICLTACSFVSDDRPFSLPIRGLPSGDYTLSITLVGFSPTPLPTLLPFSVSAVAAPPSPLPALSTWSAVFSLGGLILVALFAMRHRVPTRN